MSKGDAEILMDFKTGGAAQAQTVTQGVFRNAEQGMKRVHRANAAGMQDVKRNANGLLGTMTALSRSFATIGAAAGVGSVLAASTVLFQSAAKIEQASALMEKAITPLSSLGSNAVKMPALRAQVGQAAAGTGRSVEEVAQMEFAIQSSTGNLSDAERQDLSTNALSMADATGGNLGTSANLLVKAYQIYGDEVQSITELTNKLMHTQDAAAVSFEDLATRLPELAAAGELVGASLDEVLASIIASTKRTGSVEKTFTGMRNAMLIMEDAEKKGIQLTGDFSEKLAQLQVQFDKNPKGMRDLFGVENITTVKALVDAMPDMQANENILAGIDGSKSRADEILQQRLQDPAHRRFKINEANKSLRENAPALSGETDEKSWLQSLKRRMDLGALAAQYESGEGPGSISSIIGATKGLIGDSESLQRGREIEITKIAPGPLRDALLEENFHARNKEELDRIYGRDLLSQTGLYYSEKDRAKIEEIKNTPFDLKAERERYEYQDPANMRALEDNTRSMDALTKAIERLQQGNNRAVAPGGSKANYNETL